MNITGCLCCGAEVASNAGELCDVCAYEGCDPAQNVTICDGK